MRLSVPVLALVPVLVLVTTLARCSQEAPDRYDPRTPAIAFPGATCPPSLGRADDVAPGGAPDDALMRAEPRPRSALVCEYRGRFGSKPSPTRALDTEERIGPAAATALASAAGGVSVATPPPGTVDCPDDRGTTTVITFTFTYAQRRPVSLWWLTSGCQTIDDGRVRASQLGNPSFWTFETVFRRSTRRAG